MAFTSDEIQTIKDLLDGQKIEIISDVDRKITTVYKNLERSLHIDAKIMAAKIETRLTEEIHTTEDNLKSKIAQLQLQETQHFDEMQQRINGLVKEIAHDIVPVIPAVEDIEDLQKRVSSLEQPITMVK